MTVPPSFLQKPAGILVFFGRGRESLIIAEYHKNRGNEQVDAKWMLNFRPLTFALTEECWKGDLYLPAIKWKEPKTEFNQDNRELPCTPSPG